MTKAHSILADITRGSLLRLLAFALAFAIFIECERQSPVFGGVEAVITYLVRPTASMLTPGTGSNDAHTPTQIGSSTGADENAIARSDVVDYQTYTTTLNVGVVAFHINGINYVEFQADGGSKVRSSTMALNSTTGVVEYFVTLAAKASDGVCNVRAVVVPIAGVTRAVDIVLYSNANTTSPNNVTYVATDGNDTTGNGTNGTPYATIMKAANALQAANGTGNADGGTIYLKTGSHVLGTYSFGLLTTTVNRWMTIRPAPGLTKADVTITGSGSSDGLRTRLVCIRDCAITGQLTSHGGTEDYLWLDDCRLTGAGRTTNSTWLSTGWSGSYWTNCEASDLRDGIVGATIARDCDVHDIGSDAYSGSGLVVNCTVSDIDASGTEFHADVVQYFPSASNAIVYGLVATVGIAAQGLFAANNIPVQDVAFVDCEVTIDATMYAFQFGGATRHLFVKDCVIGGGLGAIWRTDFAFVATNVVLENTTFSGGPSAVAGVTVR